MRRDTWCSAVISIAQHLSPSLRGVNSHLIPSQDGKCSCLMNFLQSHLGRFKTTPPAAGRGVINDGCGLEQSRTKGTRLLQRGASSDRGEHPLFLPKNSTAHGEGSHQPFAWRRGRSLATNYFGTVYMSTSKQWRWADPCQRHFQASFCFAALLIFASCPKSLNSPQCISLRNETAQK